MREIRLRPYQEPGVAGVRRAYAKGKKAPVFVMATGGGKTFCFSFITRGAVAKGNRVWILVHRSELVDQASRSLTELGVSHGLISAKRTADKNHMVQVVSVQTLIRRITDFAPNELPDLIVIDEGHHAVAGTWKKIIDACPDARLLLVTATPERLDGKGLGDVADEMILGPQAGELIADAWLSHPIYYAIPNNADFSQVHRSGQDLNKKELAEATAKSTIFGDAVENYKRVCPYAPAVAFCVNLKHAEETTLKFREAGFRWAVLDGKIDPVTRRRLIAELSDGRLHGISTVEVVNEGFDLPVVTTAILLRRTDSLALHLQQIGRVLRPVYLPGMPLETVEDRLMAMAKGQKPFAIILDHVGNCLRHGLAETDRAWSLEGAKARKKKTRDNGEQVQLRQCPKCFAIHPPGPSCFACGHIYDAKGREIRVVEGELVPMISGHVADDRFTQCKCGFVHSKNAKECPSCKHSDAPADFDGGAMLASLIAIGKKKGMKNPVGWASHVYRSKMAERMQNKTTLLTTQN